MSDKLIVYYSRADENYVNGMLKFLNVGNTEIAANIIQEFTGADVFKIEQEVPYSKGYNECIAQAQEEQRNNARPKVKNLPDDIDKYSEIYLCYPNYWSTMPMAVFTFLEQYDFSGKIIKPLCTHEGSGLGCSMKDIQKICPTATVKDGIAIQGARVEKSRKDIEKWILKN